MDYQCQDCSYKAPTMAHGRCPGCGSSNVKKPNKQDLSSQSKANPYRLAIGIGLWIYLLYAIINKFSA